MAAAVSAATIALMAAALTAQPKANFAGKWVLERASNGRDGLGRELTITQDVKTLTIEYMTVGQDPESLKLVYKLDGIEHKAGQAREVSKATWSGNTLVITTGASQRILSLDGGNLVVDTSTTGFGPKPSKIVYKKPLLAPPSPDQSRPGTNAKVQAFVHRA